MSCLELDKSIKAVQRFIKINQRREFVPVEHLYASEWRLDGHYFPSVYAGRRSRPLGPVRRSRRSHTIGKLGKSPKVSGGGLLIDSISSSSTPTIRGSGEYNGLRRLWHAGIHPTAIRRLRELLGSLPPHSRCPDYIAAAYGGSPPRFQRSK